MSQRHLRDRRARPRHEIDHTRGKSRCFEQLDDHMCRKELCRSRLPNDGVAHDRGRRRQIAGDRREVERRDRENESFERAVVHAVPVAGWGDRLVLLLQLRADMYVPAPEVDQLACRVDLGLMHGLALTQDGCGVEPVTPRAAEEVRGAQEDGRPCLPRRHRPRRPCRECRLHRTSNVIRSCPADLAEHERVPVRCPHLQGITSAVDPDGVDRRPPWLTVRIPMGEGYTHLKGIMRGLELNTVCEEARCPNIAECWGHGTATFMILGDVCTRACAFCAVKSGKRGGDIDVDEPQRVAEAVVRMALRHAVVTSVDRDDLADGGAAIFAATIRGIRERAPETTIEVLTPDFQGDHDALRTVMDAVPEIFNHNVETIGRLYRRVRPKADLGRSLELLRAAKRMQARSRTKSGLMVGLGEEMGEVKELLRDMRAHDVEIVTIGQYLRPSLKHHPLIRFWHPDEFAELREYGLGFGVSHVESVPLVRSSYHAHEQDVAAQAV